MRKKNLEEQNHKYFSFQKVKNSYYIFIICGVCVGALGSYLLALPLSYFKLEFGDILSLMVATLVPIYISKNIAEILNRNAKSLELKVEAIRTLESYHDKIHALFHENEKNLSINYKNKLEEYFRHIFGFLSFIIENEELNNTSKEFLPIIEILFGGFSRLDYLITARFPQYDIYSAEEIKIIDSQIQDIYKQLLRCKHSIYNTGA